MPKANSMYKQGSKKTAIPACPLGKQLSNFACPGPLGKHQRYLAKQENVLVPDHRTGIFRALINSTTQYRIQTLRLGGGGGGGKGEGGRSRNRGAPLDTPLLPTPLLEWQKGTGYKGMQGGSNFSTGQQNHTARPFTRNTLVGAP